LGKAAEEISEKDIFYIKIAHKYLVLQGFSFPKPVIPTVVYIDKILFYQYKLQ